MVTEARTLPDVDRDLAELQRRRAKARAQGDIDLVLVLSTELNRVLEERAALTRD